MSPTKTELMWIIITGVVLSSPLILFYLVNDSSIVIDKKNQKIIILDKTPPTVIKFSDLINIDLIVNDTRTITPHVKAKPKFINNLDSVSLKLTVGNIDNPVYVQFLTNNSFEYKNSTKRALALYNKLSEIIDFTNGSLTKARRVKNSAEFQLKKLNEFRGSIIRQSAS